MKADNFMSYSDDLLRAIQKSNGYADDIIRQVIKYGDDTAVIIGTYGDDAIGFINKYGDDVIDVIYKYEDDAIDGLKKGMSPDEIRASKEEVKLPDYVKLSEELGDKLKNEGYKIIDIEDAAQANADWLAKGYSSSPIAANTKVYNAEAGKFHYVRTYNTEWNNYNGKWIMRAEDIEGLSASEIAEKYAMPSIPDMICDVKLPYDTPLEISIVGEQLDWENSIGGNTQYAIKDVETLEEWFVNKRPLN